MKVNGLGKPMKICEYHYELLFAAGERAVREASRSKPTLLAKLTAIKLLAHEGLLRLKDPAYKNKVTVNASTPRRRSHVHIDVH
jgi:hypothetical protein